MFVNTLSDYPRTFCPYDLNDNQKEVRDFGKAALDLIKNPTDRYQYLNAEFRFGIGKYVLKEAKVDLDEVVAEKKQKVDKDKEVAEKK